MEVDFCVAALEEALSRPQIFNTDQGSQFSEAFTSMLLAQAEVSMDGRGRLDNVFVDGCGAASCT